jgi:hypothetical protein
LCLAFPLSRLLLALTYDALELLRPIADEKVFDFVGKTRFRRGDFLVALSGKSDVIFEPASIMSYSF